MTQDVKDELNKKDGPLSNFHQTLLDESKALVKLSRSKMSTYYSKWDLFDQVYRGERMLDEKDVQAAAKDEPVKMVVPHTFAQVMTFSSFLFLLFTQNRTFFELTPTGAEDHGQKHEDMEAVLENNLRYNQWNSLLFQQLLDVSRFGLCINDCCWTKDVVHAYVEGQPQVGTFQNVQFQSYGQSEWQEFVKYEGNIVSSVSPYRFFPDPAFPITDFKRGRFCADEMEYSKEQLFKMQEAGEVAGIDDIPPFPANWDKLRGGDTRTAMDLNKTDNFLIGPTKANPTVLVTRMQRWLVPSKYEIGPNDKKLGPEEFPVLYHLWYANDSRVIRCEPAYYWHNEFSWNVGQFTPDMHHTVNRGLADLIYRLQDVITWHINARITDVRRNLRGRNIVDPSGIEMSTLDGDGDIYLRKSAAKSDVRRWVTPMQVNDVTGSHMTDAEVLGKIMEIVTGVNNNAMGQYNSGRRSAQESRTVTAGAAGRMKMHGQLIWDSAIAPLGRKALSNCRQSLSSETFGRIVGLDNDPQSAQMRYSQFKGTPAEVICGDDYFVFDSTLSSEKGFMAQSLQELLGVILQSDPVAAQRMAQGVDPVKIVEEIQYLRGSGNIKRFRYTPEEQQAIRAAQQQQFEAQQQSNKPKVNVSLSGKLTPEQEAEAASLTLGTPPRVGLPQQTSTNGQH